MKSFIKYGVVPILIFLFLLIATVLVLPVLINVQKYTPEIEKTISDATGRSFTIGKDLGLSFFPWVTLSFSDMRLGNPEGFQAVDFVKIQSLEARVKLLPLLKRELQFSRLVASGLQLNLEKTENGEVNWDFSKGTTTKELSGTALSPVGALMEQGLSFALFAVTDGQMSWNDRKNNSSHKFNDLMLMLRDVNSDDPAHIEFQSAIDGKQFALEGEVVSLNKEKGEVDLVVDLSISTLDTIQGIVKGQLKNVLESPGYDLTLQVSTFSPRKVLHSFNPSVLVNTADNTVLDSMGFDLDIKGNTEQLSVERGKIKIDDSLLNFSLVLIDFDKPDLGFSLDIDSLNLDRYLPVETADEKNISGTEQNKKGGARYSRLREITLAGALRIDDLKLGGISAQGILTQVRAEKGVLEVAPATFDLYKGRSQASMTVDIQGEIPQTEVTLQSEGVQVGSLLQDFMGKNFLSGNASVDLVLQFSGDNREAMRKSLGGEAALLFKDGVLKGVDLVRKTGESEVPYTDSDSHQKGAGADFSELMSGIALTNGLAESIETTLKSPNFNLKMTGTADFVSQTVDLRFKPVKGKIIKGKGEGITGRGRVLPLSISGPISAPSVTVGEQKHADSEVKTSNAVAAQNMVDKKLPPPSGEDTGDMIGKALVDPAIVTQRFGPQPETIRREKIKKQHQSGSGLIKVQPLRQEGVFTY